MQDKALARLMFLRTGAGVIVDVPAALAGIEASLSTLAGAPAGPTTYTPTFSDVTAAGSIAAGAKSVAFDNIGSADATVMGATLKPGDPPFEICAPSGGVLSTLTYDASGTVIRVGEMR